MYTVIEGGVTAAAGFQTASTAAGIKYKNRKDMAMIYSEKPCKAAGTFTTNIVKAAPVKWDQKIVKESEYAQAVVINAGIANACTGAEGMLLRRNRPGSFRGTEGSGERRFSGIHRRYRHAASDG